MKRISFLLLAFFIGTSAAVAQNLAYVNTEYILSKMPAYIETQGKIDKVVEGWNNEIQQRYKEIDQMYKRFQAEQVLLSDSERKRREEEIVNKEKETRDLQKKHFGTNGDLFQKKQELVKPLQDQIYAAIEKLAGNRKLDMVLDKSSGVSILFANPKFDITDDVLKELGVTGK